MVYRQDISYAALIQATETNIFALRATGKYVTPSVLTRVSFPSHGFDLVYPDSIELPGLSRPVFHLIDGRYYYIDDIHVFITPELLLIVEGPCPLVASVSDCSIVMEATSKSEDTGNQPESTSLPEPEPALPASEPEKPIITATPVPVVSAVTRRDSKPKQRHRKKRPVRFQHVPGLTYKCRFFLSVQPHRKLLKKMKDRLKYKPSLEPFIDTGQWSRGLRLIHRRYRAVRGLRSRPPNIMYAC